MNSANTFKPDNLKDLIKPYLRNTWLPRLTQESSPAAASKFSGIPMLSRGGSWPLCAHCHTPMQLFLQLSSADLPESAGMPFGEGYLQVFYCTNLNTECEIECEAYFPFAKSTLVRVIPFNDAWDSGLALSPVADAFPEQTIIGWEPHIDYPNWEELQDLGCSLTEAQIDALCDLEYPVAGDKLLGWPHWIQGVEYPECPRCERAMPMIFQIDSECSIPYMFGDAGCAHITQCAHHPEQMAIAWACC